MKWICDGEYFLQLASSDMGESCFPSIELLSEETSLSTRAIIKHLDLAEKAAFIVKTKHGFAGKRWARNEYKATFPSLQNDEMVVNDVHYQCDKVVNLVHEGSEPNDQMVVNHVHTSSSINYSINNTNTRARQPENKTMSGEGALACRLIPLGVSVTSIHPTLCKWVADKIPIELIEECLALARQSKPAPEKIPANYLDSIIRNAMRPKKANNSWLMSDEATLAHGESVGLPPKIGESMADYKMRLKAA
jgi:hypothetical protein